jgi:hypothetical protein
MENNYISRDIYLKIRDNKKMPNIKEINKVNIV